MLFCKLFYINAKSITKPLHVITGVRRYPRCSEQSILALRPPRNRGNLSYTATLQLRSPQW